MEYNNQDNAEQVLSANSTYLHEDTHNQLGVTGLDTSGVSSSNDNVLCNSTLSGGAKCGANVRRILEAIEKLSPDERSDLLYALLNSPSLSVKRHMV